MLVSATAMLNNVPSYFNQNYTNLVFAKVNFTKFFAASTESKFWSSNEINVGYGPFLKMMLREQISNLDSSKWGNLVPTRWTSCKKRIL